MTDTQYFRQTSVLTSPGKRQCFPSNVLPVLIDKAMLGKLVVTNQYFHSTMDYTALHRYHSASVMYQEPFGTRCTSS